MKQIILLFFVSCGCQLFAQTATISVSNPVKQQRMDELVVLTRHYIEKKLGQINTGQYVVVNYDGIPIVTQFDDLDQDGVWDELCFLQNFNSKEKCKFILSILNSRPHNVETRAHVRHKRKNADNSFGADLLSDSIPAGQLGADFNKVKLPLFLTEGPAWENDKVGFRLYFDVRNGKDIWGKTTTKMVLDEVGVNPKRNYHERADWGMDVLKVGSSLGAGALALKYNDGTKDTIVRLGGVNMGKVVYQKIADGPVRAIFRLHYPNWRVGVALGPASLTEEVSIWGGQYFYQSKVTVSNAPHNSSLVTGIVNLKSKEMFQAKNRKEQYVYTYDVQSENHDKMGMALLVSKGEQYATGTTPNTNTDVQNTYYIAMPVKTSTPVSFRFLAGWEQSELYFKTKQGFEQFVKTQSHLYMNPVIIK